MRLLSALAAIAIGCVACLPAHARQVRGSGSTFVFPMMAQWVAEYGKSAGATTVVYEPDGSIAGLTDLKSNISDFAVTDAPLTSEELRQEGFVQFPLVIGGIVPVFNIDGIGAGELHFAGSVLADIYLGKITKWNDPAIVSLNPGARLPDHSIIVIHRSDNSGTSYNWVNFLCGASPEWKSKVGAGTSLAWPAGYGARGNGGVVGTVLRTRGAIGYVEFGRAVQTGVTFGLVQNAAGNFVVPGAVSFDAAASTARWSAANDFQTLLTDAPDPRAYPISATSFVVMREQVEDQQTNLDALAFFRWALEKGQDSARSMDYVPLPDSLVQQVEAYWQTRLHLGAIPKQSATAAAGGGGG